MVQASNNSYTVTFNAPLAIMENKLLLSYSKELAGIALKIGAIKISPEHPFTWASGYKMPIYNDNRLLLCKSEYRRLIAEGFHAIIKLEKIDIDVVAGTATAGIPHAATLADLLETPLIYVRSAAKSHGMQSQIEGVLHKNQKVVVIEDLVSTGESALKAAQAIRDAGGIVDHCLCIFNYGFEKSKIPFQEKHCRVHSLLTYPTLIDYAMETGAITAKQKQMLDSWRQNPWGNRHP